MMEDIINGNMPLRSINPKKLADEYVFISIFWIKWKPYQMRNY